MKINILMITMLFLSSSAASASALHEADHYDVLNYATVKFNNAEMLSSSSMPTVPTDYKFMLQHYCSDVREISPYEFVVNLNTIFPGKHNDFAAFLWKESYAFKNVNVIKDLTLAALVYHLGHVEWDYASNSELYLRIASSFGLDVPAPDETDYGDWTIGYQQEYNRRHSIYEHVRKTLFPLE